jgi:hypothetical protein
MMVKMVSAILMLPLSWTGGDSQDAQFFRYFFHSGHGPEKAAVCTFPDAGLRFPEFSGCRRITSF